jgi:hypothetical protein
VANTSPSAEVLTRLIKLCGMLGSDHDGERASAGLKASKLLMENHLTWHDVISSPNSYQSAEQGAKQQAPHIAICKLAKDLLDDKIINDWEHNFLISISGNLTVSDKQQVVVDRIRRKAEVAGYF